MNWAAAVGRPAAITSPDSFNGIVRQATIATQNLHVLASALLPLCLTSDFRYPPNAKCSLALAI